jgi:hypothetical protein
MTIHMVERCTPEGVLHPMQEIVESMRPSTPARKTGAPALRMTISKKCMTTPWRALKKGADIDAAPP